MDRSKMDSHADTCVAGCNMVVLEDTGQTVSVTPFTSEYNALKGNPIVSVATMYDCPTDGETYLLIVILRKTVTCVAPLSQST